MPRAEGVVFRLCALRKAGNSIDLTQMRHLLASSGDDFMTVALMTHVPHDFVIRRVEYMMQGNGQLNRTEIGRQMTTGLRHRIEDKRAQFLSQLPELLARECTHIRR